MVEQNPKETEQVTSSPATAVASSGAAASDPSEEEKKEEVKLSGNGQRKLINREKAAQSIKAIAGQNKEKQQKLMEVVKALSAMRLCKEDGVPNAILCRRTNEPKEGETLFVPALPTAAGVVSDLANETPAEVRGDPCLFQGSVGVAYNLKSLQENGITHILTAAANLGSRFKDQFNYKILKLLDTPNQNIVQCFDEAIGWIDQVLRESPNNRVLVHCFAGKSRATTITCSYLLGKQGYNLRQALLHVRACRQIAWPNIGFLCQLKAFESKTFGECSDVPLRLEQLFGVPPPKQDPAENEGDASTELTQGKQKQKIITINPASNTSAAAAGSAPAMSEEVKSELKALGDAQEILGAPESHKTSS